MILRNIFLYPDLVEFDLRRDEASKIRDETRHICNFLDRKLYSIKFKSDLFNRICIIGKSKAQDSYINSESSISVYVELDIDECIKLPKEKLEPYYCNLLVEGLSKCAKEYSIPINELLLWIKEFRDGGYKNEWVFKEKSFKSQGLKCRLDCKMTLDEFTLRLAIFKNNSIVFDEEILKTPPDEICFKHEFKDIIIDDESIVVTTNYSNKILFQKPISSLL